MVQTRWFTPRVIGLSFLSRLTDAKRRERSVLSVPASTRRPLFGRGPLPRWFGLVTQVKLELHDFIDGTVFFFENGIFWSDHTTGRFGFVSSLRPDRSKFSISIRKKNFFGLVVDQLWKIFWEIIIMFHDCLQEFYKRGKNSWVRICIGFGLCTFWEFLIYRFFKLIFWWLLIFFASF